MPSCEVKIVTRLKPVKIGPGAGFESQLLAEKYFTWKMTLARRFIESFDKCCQGYNFADGSFDRLTNYRITGWTKVLLQ